MLKNPFELRIIYANGTSVTSGTVYGEPLKPELSLLQMMRQMYDTHYLGGLDAVKTVQLLVNANHHVKHGNGKRFITHDVVLLSMSPEDLVSCTTGKKGGA